MLGLTWWDEIREEKNEDEIKKETQWGSIWRVAVAKPLWSRTSTKCILSERKRKESWEGRVREEPMKVYIGQGLPQVAFDKHECSLLGFET